jgi:hypothetical protein
MSAEYGVNIDYTSLGRIHFKIELMADSHEQALKSAQDVLNIQKKSLCVNTSAAVTSVVTNLPLVFLFLPSAFFSLCKMRVKMRGLCPTTTENKLKNNTVVPS